MKTLHVSLNVTDMADSVRYYTAFFGRPPDVDKEQFAKWWLDDPKVNFALNGTAGSAGLNHLGIEVDGKAELIPVYERAKSAGKFNEEGDTTCCYTQSEKGWAVDPQGVPWEIFATSSYLHEQEESEVAAYPPGCC